MRNLLLLFVSAVLLLSYACSKTAPADLKYDISVMSFNLRYSTEADGENQWKNRKEACIKMLNTEIPAVFGIQEGLHSQVTYLDTELPDYNYIGVGRDDGESEGEYCAVFYNSSRFELLDENTFWLSETPDQVSFGWDAACRRVVTWVKLKDKDHDKIIYVFNTHFDHEGKEAREESAKLLVKKIEELADDNAPIFITGDFNAMINNSILDPINDKFKNTKKEAKYSDGKKSYNGFGNWLPSVNIDFIFYKNAKALSFKTVDDDYGVEYISDHYPIIGRYSY